MSLVRGTGSISGSRAEAGRTKPTEKDAIKYVDARLHESRAECTFQIVLDTARSGDRCAEFEHNKDTACRNDSANDPAHQGHSYAS